MKVTEKKLADGIIKLDCEATAIEVNNALKEAAEAFAMQMGVRPAPGKSIEELAREQLGIADLAGDMRVLKEAQQAAQVLLEADPGLSRPEHAPLLGRVRRLFAQHGDMFN